MGPTPWVETHGYNQPSLRDEQKTATGKSADVHVTPTTPNQPEQLQVRVQLMKSNAPYGQLSDAAYVTVNP